MNRSTKNRQWMVTASLCAALLAASPAPADGKEPVGTEMTKRLLAAVEANDYKAMVAESHTAFKAGLTKQMLQAVSAQMAPRLKKGYELSHLGDLNQQGCLVQLWKLIFKDGGDDTLVKVVLKDGKTAGFWLQ